MRVEFDAPGTATYTTEWHQRGGEWVCRRIRVERHELRTPLRQGVATEYRIEVTEHTGTGATREMWGGGVSTFKAALDMLSRAFGQCVSDGFATRRDLERLPTA